MIVKQGGKCSEEGEDCSEEDEEGEKEEVVLTHLSSPVQRAGA